ncbi:MAG TPA: hypothetical protein VGM90_20760 [Kofleriaceae bacterium]
MAKRSPIAGYNHNVKYRGLIFHVQTEDSGLASPHLFTHLFYEGVIISTRKLVYDAGSAEDAIKGLMQSQHKIAMKELKNGKFDDKIDVYLAGTAGLEPRTTPATPSAAAADPEAGPPRQSEVDLVVRPSDPEIRLDGDDEPEIAISRTQTPQPAVARTTTPARTSPAARTQTADRRSPASQSSQHHVIGVGPPPPNMADLDPPTDLDASGAMRAAAENATQRTELPPGDSAPEIQIYGDTRTRSKHDTEVQSDGVPGQIGEAKSGRAGDSIPPLPPPPGSDKRPNALAAGALPPSRPINRPPTRQAIQPPAVVSRPISNHQLVDRPGDDRSNRDSDAIEVYAPPPPSVEAPPGVTERPGQYAQHKKVSQRLPSDAIKGAQGDRSGSVAIPAGLARPGRPSQAPPIGAQQRALTPMPGVPATARAATPSSEHRVPDLASRPEQRPRTPTPPRISTSAGPAPSRTASTGSGGVVMTRPAVIVGAPAKQTVPPRVRKAREEEGRGFGQGLISEKSLDEVILAYLSEDADEK